MATGAIDSALQALGLFSADSMTNRIRSLETALAGRRADEAVSIAERANATDVALRAALEIKAAASQINVAIHALGILLALPEVMTSDERIVDLSLGAGNTGKHWDLETDLQIAEFKFIRWRGGAEAIRQNGLFLDVFWMAEFDTPKRRVMYVTGAEMPLKFLAGGRALSSVLSRNDHAKNHFASLHGDRFVRVRDYWNEVSARVEIVDLLPLVPALRELPAEDAVQDNDPSAEASI